MEDGFAVINLALNPDLYKGCDYVKLKFLVNQCSKVSRKRKVKAHHISIKVTCFVIFLSWSAVALTCICIVDFLASDRASSS